MRFGLRNQDMPLDPDVERELAAVDAGLMGLRVAPDLEDLADLAQDTRTDRPAPESDFAAKLDEWAAAGFPRDGRMGDGGERERGSATGGLRGWLRSTPPRRLLLPIGAAATLLVAAAVGISVSDQIGGSSAPTMGPGTQSASVPETAGAGGSGRGSSGGTPEGQTSEGVTAGSPGARSTSDLALQSRHRKVAQNAQLVLSTEPQDVRDVADEVVGVVDRYNGFVVSSDVTSGRPPNPTPVPLEGNSRAERAPQGSGTFELRIPAQHLQQALGDMSKLAHVTSRTEGVKDITKRFDQAKAHLHDLNVQRAHLLRQLANAVAITERESLQARLDVVENQLASARDHYGHVQDRIRMVPVGVEIRGQAGVDSGAGGSWGIGDAFHDAGRVLTVIAGILLISAAVLVPIGLIGGLAWFTARALMRRRREDALQ